MSASGRGTVLRKFLSTPSARRATTNLAAFADREIFLSTPSARRATVTGAAAVCCARISIHALREEGDLSASGRGTVLRKFLSTPSARRATTNLAAFADREIFLSTPSARRATWCGTKRADAPFYFYPRPPRGGRPRPQRLRGHQRAISIHALREEGDVQHSRPHRPSLNISIHALREEGDPAFQPSMPLALSFLSTPSARRATSWTMPIKPCWGNFYPRPPRGGRP